MREIRTSGLMSEDGKRGGASASVLAPILDSTNWADAGRIVSDTRPLETYRALLVSHRRVPSSCGYQGFDSQDRSSVDGALKLVLT